MQARSRVDRASHDSNRRQHDNRQNGSSSRPLNGAAERGHQFSTSRDEYNFEDDEDIEEDSYEQGPRGGGSRRTPSDADEEAAEFHDLMAYSDSEDYYSILGLSRQPPPTESQIRSAYRNLLLSFHPDKQPAVLQKIAVEHYRRIQAAHDTLVDPQKRVVYDLVGEEGVQAEWGPGGAMARGGEAQKQVGTRAMGSEEFRAWFLRLMKRRERQILESLVNDSGSMVIGFDASSMLGYDRETQTYSLQRAFPQPKRFNLSHSFQTPIPFAGFLRHKNVDDEEIEVEGGTGDSKSAGNETSMDDEMKLIIESGIDGFIQRRRQKTQVEDAETGKVVTMDLDLEPFIVAPQFHLGWGVHHILSGADSDAGSRVRSLLRGSSIRVGGGLLPSFSLNTSIKQAFTPVKGTRPLFVSLDVSALNDVREIVPQLGVSIHRQLGLDKVVYCSWKSGLMLWPAPLRNLFERKTESHTVANLSSAVSIGVRPLNLPGSEDDDGDEDEHSRKQKSAMRQNWEVDLQATPMNADLTIKYKRFLFGGIADEALRSEWNGEGRVALKPRDAPRPVLLQLQYSVDLELNSSWEVTGSRKFGDFTRMGLGFGVQSRGVTMLVSWSRLGQSIKLPILLFPADTVAIDAAGLIITLPWLAYAAVEYGIVRPRDRRRRRAAISRRKRQLKRIVAKQKVQSEQAVALMAEQVSRRQRQEAEQHGLVILEATYGPSSKNTKAKSDDVGGEWINVTTPVAALVDRGQLVIPRSLNKVKILGFYDPAPLSPKTLRVRYLFAGQEHITEVEDGEDLKCPMREHNMDIDAVN